MRIVTTSTLEADKGRTGLWLVGVLRPANSIFRHQTVLDWLARWTAEEER